MYRAITWWALRRGVDPADAAALGALARQASVDVVEGGDDACGARVMVDGHDATPHLREPGVDAAVSLVSAVPAVRDAMVSAQRRIASGRPVVMVGRDIGTVVLPGATLKVYLDASPHRRAQRRSAQKFPGATDVAQVQAALEERDRLDSERDVSPLRPAADAVIIDTEALALDEVVDRIEGLARERDGEAHHA